MPTPRPPPVPAFTAEVCADPQRLARMLDQFARDVSAYAKQMEEARIAIEARLKAGGL